MPDWYTASGQTRLTAAWPGAPIANVELLGMLLDTARLQVVQYAPEATEVAAVIESTLLALGLDDRLDDVLDALQLVTAEPPFNLVYAQLQQAKNLWAAGSANASGEQGGEGFEGFTFQPRPLDKTIRQIIRPVNTRLTGGL